MWLLEHVACGSLLKYFVCLVWAICQFPRIYFFIITLQLDSFGQQELASRLTLNCMNAYIEPQKIKDIPVTIIDVSVNIILESVFFGLS